MLLCIAVVLFIERPSNAIFIIHRITKINFTNTKERRTITTTAETDAAITATIDVITAVAEITTTGEAAGEGAAGGIDRGFISSEFSLFVFDEARTFAQAKRGQISISSSLS